MKTLKRQKIHRRLRHTVKGTSVRPRLSVYRSLNHIFAQLIDDESGCTLVSATSLKDKGSLSEKAKLVGLRIAKLAGEKKIKTAVFDRGGFAYMGAVKILCETVRDKGLKI